MNFDQRWPTTQVSLIDELLADIAVKIQLSPTLHEKAVGHYEAVHQHIDREGSPLRGRVTQFYPQGSMAIGATIRSGDDEDQFDIDLIAQVQVPGAEPGQLLDLLFDAINGPEGSKYHGQVERQTRCVTVNYADMHLDVTPLVRNPNWTERGGHIAHAKAELPRATHEFIAANPWGFADWFRSQTPKDDWFRDSILRKAFAYDGRQVLAEAEADPVPEHQTAFAKPMVVVALQLMKRWVRLVHLRKKDGSRCIPSVALSRSFAANAGRTKSLIEELILQAEVIGAELKNASIRRELVRWTNPRLDADVLTDRWPGDLATQWAFAQDVEFFVGRLKEARDATDLRVIQRILQDLFGEKVGASVVSEFYERGAKDVSLGASKLSAAGVPLAGLSKPAAAPSVTVPKHRFFGD
jgi:hypothetical protein